MTRAAKNLLLRKLSQNLPTPLLRKLYSHIVLFFICLKAAELTLALVGTVVKIVVAPAEAGAKDSGCGGVDVDE
jgi:hypothetical protein